MPPLPERTPPTLRAIHEARLRASRQEDETPHIRVSAAHHECARKLWLDFRWTSIEEPHSPRMLRLFGTGHMEERRLLDDLERIEGVTIYRFDPQTGRQWEVSIGEMIVGHMDAVALGIPEAPKTWHVVECKSANDKSFQAVRKKGVQAGKPEHWLQMQLYMLGAGLTRALYLLVNKNTDEEYVERVRLNEEEARRAVARLEAIAALPAPPGRLHENPDARTAWHCSWCRHKPVCHESVLARRNCRTCAFSTPLNATEWVCERWGRALSVEEQRQGCTRHVFLPALVADEQIDADPKEGTITYRTPSGDVWVDGEGWA